MTLTVGSQAIDTAAQEQTTVNQPANFLRYEDRLNQDSRWALSEGSLFFEGKGLGVKIEFLIVSGYPGDGKPKPVAFPEPASVAIELDGRKYVPPKVLVEMKLASGMTNPHRLKDLADVQEVIKALKLPISFADQLNPYVQDKFRKLWAPAVDPDA
jgi:hypothetical protein